MYYVIPAKAANAAIAKKFVDFAESPEIQADGIVKQFNWYPGIDPQHVQAKLDAGGVEQAVHRHLAGRPREVRPAVPAVGVLHRHRRRVRARRAEVATSQARPARERAVRPASARPMRRGCSDREAAWHRARASAALARVRARRAGARGHRRCSSSFRSVLVRGPRLPREGRRLHARALREGVRALHAPTCSSRSAIVLLSTVLIGARRDRHRRLPDARRESARRRDPALALPLAAVHPVHRHRPGDARRSSPRTGC